MKRNFIVFLVFLLVLSCEDDPVSQDIPPNQFDVTIEQGIYGQITFWRGLFSDNADLSSGTVRPVERKIVAFKAKKFTPALAFQAYPDFYNLDFPDKVAEAVSDENGNYQMELPSGKYTILVKENDLYYSENISVDSFVNPVDVINGKTTLFNFSITYEAEFELNF